MQLRNPGQSIDEEIERVIHELKRQGANILRDIPGERGNIDHVVICSHGIFVVETKAWSKPENVWEMDFDGQRIHIATGAPDAAPIVQCKAEVGDIKSPLKDSTSKAFPVRGVVVFLDWFVNRKPGARRTEIWVLNPKELAGWIRREPDVLSAADVAMATWHLKQFVKTIAA